MLDVPANDVFDEGSQPTRPGGCAPSIGHADVGRACAWKRSGYPAQIRRHHSPGAPRRSESRCLLLKLVRQRVAFVAPLRLDLAAEERARLREFVHSAHYESHYPAPLCTTRHAVSRIGIYRPTRCRSSVVRRRHIVASARHATRHDLCGGKRDARLQTLIGR